MSQHNDPDQPLGDTPQQPAGEAAPYPPPPPIFSQEPAPEFDLNAAPPLPPAGSAYDASGNTAGTTSGSLTAPTKDERNWAMFAHLSGLIIGIIGAFTTLPAWGFIGPLAIWLMKRDESPFVSDQAKEALNFHISVGIVMFILWLLALVLIWTIIVPILAGIAMGIIGIGALILTLMAAVKSSEGQLYRYPFTLRLIN